MLVGCAGAATDDIGGDALSPAAHRTEPVTSFRCAVFPPETTMRITMTVDTEFRVVDAHNAEQSRSLGTDTAVYLIEPRPELGGRHVRIVLEELDMGSLLPTYKNAWALAIERSWIAPKIPFMIEQSANSWCWSSETGCDASDAERDQFAKSVGMNLDLLDITPALSRSLDGMQNKGDLTVPLPEPVMRRLGIKEPGLVARATRPGYPASFVITKSAKTQVERTSTAKDGTVTKEPQNLYHEAEVALVVDSQCGVVEVRRTQTMRAPMFEGKLPSAALIIRTIKWQFTPVGS